jgi:hypothetical protein
VLTELKINLDWIGTGKLDRFASRWTTSRKASSSHLEEMTTEFKLLFGEFRGWSKVSLGVTKFRKAKARARWFLPRHPTKLRCVPRFEPYHAFDDADTAGEMRDVEGAFPTVPALSESRDESRVLQRRDSLTQQ